MSDTATRLTNEVTERQLQDTIVRMATLLGWTHYHTYDSRRSAHGYPDLTMFHPYHGVLFLELKRERGRVSAHQQYWINGLRSAGANAFIVRPSMMDAVEAALNGDVRDLEDVAL